jgi:hypothetical protein
MIKLIGLEGNFAGSSAPQHGIPWVVNRSMVKTAIARWMLSLLCVLILSSWVKFIGRKQILALHPPGLII